MFLFRAVGLVVITGVAFVLSLSGPAMIMAQKKAAPPAATAIAVTTPQNFGAKRGGPAELTLTGTNLSDATGVWTSFGGKVIIPPGQTDATKLRVNIDIPATTPVGLHLFRVVTQAGISNVKPLIVDDWPEVPQKAGNSKNSTAQVVPVPCVITGNVTGETSDFYKFPVKAGESITIEAIGRRLGSPLDPVIILHDVNGRELPGLYADDTAGLQSDARIVHTFPAAGDIVVEIRDTTYRGGADYVYRLRIGTCPAATTAFPLFIQKGKPTEVGFAGPNVDGVKPMSITPPADANVVYVSPKREAGGTGWAVPVRVSEHPELVEQEPNNEQAKANKLPVPSGISARFAEKNDIDHFSFAAKKGEKLAIQALTYEVNSPCEVYFRVLDGKSTELAKSNPQQATARVEFTPPADGEYYIACEQTNYLAGANEIYHLSVGPLVPEFRVIFGADRVDIPSGGTGRLPIVGVVRPAGFTAPIDVTFVDADGLSGQFTIAPGANPVAATPLFVPIVVKPGTKSGPVIGSFQLSAKVGNETYKRTGSLIDVAKTAFAGLPNPPYELTTQIVVAVTPEPPFTLTVTFDAKEIAKGGTIKGKVTAKRTVGFTEEIVIAAGTIPANAKPTFKPVAKGATDAEVQIEIPTGTPTGPISIVLRGTAKLAGKDISVLAAPANVTVLDAKKK